MKKQTQKLTIAAMLTAMSVIIGIFCKNYLNFGGGLFRITFENLPVILGGIMLGPIAGGCIGGASDLVSYFMSGQAYPLNVIVTVGAVSVGVISGITARFIVKKRGYLQIIVSASAAHIVGSMIIKPIGLFQFYGFAVLFRIPLYLVIAPFETALICLLYKNKAFRRLVEKL